MPMLYLMFGYPGAGKSTTAKVIEQLTGAIRLSSDEVRIELFPKPTFSQQEHDALYKELDNRAEKLLSEGRNVVYDANLNRYQHRKDKYDICQRTGATAKLLWIQADKSLAKERALHESRQHLWPEAETPDQMFDRIASIIEEPGPDEPYTAIDGTKVTESYIENLLQDNF